MPLQAINAQIARFYTPGTESAYFGIVGLVAVVAGILLFIVKTNPKLNG